MSTPDADRSYLRRTALTVGIAGLVIGGLYFAISLVRVLLTLFAGLLLAVFLSGLTDVIRRRVPSLPRILVLAGVTLVLFSGLGGIFILAGPDISGQIAQLVDRLPAALQRLRTLVENTPWAQELVRNLPTIERLLPAPMEVVGGVTDVFSTTMGALTNTMIILLVGIYGAVNPDVYVSGLAHLFPKGRRARLREVLHALGRVLRWWLVGRLTSMAIVGVLTTTGLWGAGVPSAVALGLIAALLDFVPYIGPIVAVVPALLVASIVGVEEVFYVLIIYAAVQALEAYLITPLVQERAVSIPPALLIAAQVIMGVLAGATGVLMATPLAVSVIVLVQMLYVEDALGDSVKILGQH